MSEKVISPDLDFVNDVVNSGGDSLKKCFQCATCTVVCNVTPEDKPFPRKEMVHAQWGLKDELFRNPDIWVCHQCSDCTAYCPRGAKPGEVLGTIRQMSLEEFSAIPFLARALRDPKYLVFLLVVPVLLLLGLISLQDYSLSSIPRGDNGEIVYSEFIPTTFGVDPIFVTTAIFAGIVFAMGIMKYWREMLKSTQLQGTIVGALTGVVKDILAHSKFKDCEVTGNRRTAHLFVFYSFVGLAITTSMAVLYLYGYKLFHIEAFSIFHFGESPYPLYDPLKIIGNLSAIGLAVGILLVIMNRIDNAKQAGMGGYYDWLFIGVIVTVASTGILSELLRLGDVGKLAYPMYFAHLVSVWFLFAYAPFSKMAHMVYRATAMVFAKMSGR
jgi:quinone-modifying oxidoreductase subunit QmoC